ncbi:hypothetical protein [Azorhizobium doebereinerae]|uniref:hypothetical protein n=1 Tax=Azorhizobium doebereinerae TaxID=281091 RepID=UPI00040BBC06|nr:hypothetical protein [Azorhizobium doebereinerae]
MKDNPAQPAAGALSPARGAWTLSGHVRRLLRERPRTTRTELRAILRERMLLTWGTLGCQRFRAVLAQMAEAGEIALDGDDVIAVNLRQRVPRKRKPDPETAGAKRRRMREKRDARATARQEAARAKNGA